MTEISTLSASDQLTAHVTLIDSGGAGKLEIRSGVIPDGVGDAATGTVLNSIDFMDPAFGLVQIAGDDVTADANGLPLGGTNLATGVATWFRIYQGDGTAHSQGTVGLNGSGADLELADTSLTQGEPLQITEFQLTHPLDSVPTAAADPGGGFGDIQYNANGSFGGFGDYNSTLATVLFPGALNVSNSNIPFGSNSSLISLAIGANGGSPNGTTIVGPRANGSNDWFPVIGAWDNGSFREVFIGGTGWGLPDANSVQIRLAPTYTETTDSAVAVATFTYDFTNLAGPINIYPQGQLGTAVGCRFDTSGDIVINGSDTPSVPAAGTPGRMRWDTTRGEMLIDNGTAWVAISTQTPALLIQMITERIVSYFGIADAGYGRFRWNENTGHPEMLTPAGWKRIILDVT